MNQRLLFESKALWIKILVCFGNRFELGIAMQASFTSSSIINISIRVMGNF